MAPALCSRVCIMLEENEKMKNRMEKKLHHHGTALTLYDELGNGAVVYCFQSESDSADVCFVAHGKSSQLLIFLACG